jgi:hypothetical protein
LLVVLDEVDEVESFSQFWSADLDSIRRQLTKNCALRQLFSDAVSTVRQSFRHGGETDPHDRVAVPVSKTQQ